MAGRRLENVQLDNMAARDSFITFVAVDIIRRDKPGLLLVHLIDIDHTEHESGRASPLHRFAQGCVIEPRQDARLEPRRTA